MNPWRALSSLPREVWILFTTTLINRAGTMAIPFLVLYLTESRGFSAARAGLVLTVYGIGALITSPLAGRLCDRFGALRIMKLSLLLSGAILFVFPFAGSFILILAITFIWAIVSEAFRPASLAITADVVAPEQRKAAFALTRLAINLGMSVGPVAGGFLAMVSFPALFYVDGATSMLAAAVLLASAWPARAQGAPAAESSGTGSRPLSRRAGVMADRRLLYFLAALIPVQIVFFQSQAAMPLFLVRDLGLSESTYGILFAVNTVLIIFLEVPLNASMADWPHRRALGLGALLTGVGFGAMALATGGVSAALTIVIWTFGEMILLPGASAYVAEISTPERRGEYMGFYQMSFSLAFAVGPWIGTWVLERFGATTLWIAAFVTGALAAAMLARLPSKATEEIRGHAGA